MKDVLSVILGGGRGTRLSPLTKMRSKPAVPLAGKYRLIDIPVSNCLNSGLNKIFILTQFNSESLNTHIRRTYKMDDFSKGFVEILAAEQSMENADWFQGTCDAVRKCLRHFTDPKLKDILILSGDQLYIADFRKIIWSKRRIGHDISVVCKPMPNSTVHQFGVMATDSAGKITAFHEKPKSASVLDQLSFDYDGGPHCLASMGIYLFDKQVLVDLLEQNPDMTDFGKELIPLAINKYNVHAHQFDDYWADIGTIRSFYDANLLLTTPVPPLNLFDERWQVFTRPRFLSPSKIFDSRIDSSMIGEGCIIDECEINSSIIGHRSHIGKGSRIESSIIMGADYYSFDDVISRPSFISHIGKNCLIKNAIIDKNVCFGDNVNIVNKARLKDYESGFVTIRDGITIIEKNAVVPDGFEV